ncbi:MAG: DNA polymerase III subunit epsilon, partial [Pseudomonadota bacterium]
MRQIVLDTETTGIDTAQDHRIIEIGAIELVNRRITGQVFHRYLNPERNIDEGAQAVHGISRADLENEPHFAEIAEELLEFVRGAELVIHNAAFDVGFLEHELKRMQHPEPQLARHCDVRDTLKLARELHPGQRNSLDALCRRYEVDNSKRDLHGALLDADLLARVYLAMTGGQATLTLEARADERARGAGSAAAGQRGPRPPLKSVAVAADEQTGHRSLLEKVA